MTQVIERDHYAKGISRVNGVDEAMYTGDVPWKGVGTYIGESAVTSVEALEAAHLNWEVVGRPIYIKTCPNRDGNPQFNAVPNKMAQIRRDTHDVLAVTSPDYRPIQNTEAFEFFDKVVGEGKAVYTVAGSLNQGRRVWIMANLPGDITIKGEDKIGKNLLLTNAHDGSSAFKIQAVPYRFYCTNVLPGAFYSSKGKFTARHTSGVMNRVNDAQEFLGLADEYFDVFGKLSHDLSIASMSNDEAMDFFGELYEINVEKFLEDDLKNAGSRGSLMAFETSLELFRYGRGNEGKTRWDALNAVTEYYDHVRPVRGRKDSVGEKENLEYVNARLENSWYGNGVNVKDKAWQLLTEKPIFVPTGGPVSYN